MAGKGDAMRPTDHKAFREFWDRAFGKDKELETDDKEDNGED